VGDPWAVDPWGDQWADVSLDHRDKMVAVKDWTVTIENA
jgi:hypothetical protein